MIIQFFVSHELKYGCQTKICKKCIFDFHYLDITFIILCLGLFQIVLCGGMKELDLVLVTNRTGIMQHPCRVVVTH